ncbi:unnamed protein product [Pleuronectes platessa]|uniref:Uncharacterized protein n=1 Tax=Pleuronectes platessa TaxID=8262 RepID=A0A9N7YFL2_PLEPL|nr:unnamed protein product [Pleuronectes platessa]
MASLSPGLSGECGEGLSHQHLEAHAAFEGRESDESVVGSHVLICWQDLGELGESGRKLLAPEQADITRADTIKSSGLNTSPRVQTGGAELYQPPEVMHIAASLACSDMGRIGGMCVGGGLFVVASLWCLDGQSW